MANVFSSLTQGSNSFMSPRHQMSSTKTMPMPAQQPSLLSKIGSGISNYWNNSGPGRFDNPKSSDYVGNFGQSPQPQSGLIGTALGPKPVNAQVSAPSSISTATASGQTRVQNNPAPMPQGPGSQGSGSQGPVTISPTPNYAKGEGYTGNSPNAYQNTIQQSPNSGEGLYQQFVRQLANQNKNTELGQNAQDIANKAGAVMSSVGQQGARGEAGYLTTGTSPVGEGNAAVLAQTTAAQQQAIAQGANMQLAGNAQALTGQSQQQGALNQATGYAAPQQYSPTTTPYNPAEGTFGGGGQANRAFGGGQAGANVDIGAKYQGNKATLATLTGAEDGSGTGGSVGDFNSAMQSNGLNPTDIGVFNNIMNAWSNNTSGPNAMVQNQFTNLMKQYAKILGDQRITDLITSSSGSTMSNFINSLTRAAQQVQNGYYAAGTGGTGTGAPGGNSQSGGSGNDPLNLGI